MKRPQRKASPKPNAVRVREEWLTLPTYEPAAPDKNPMFLERRVYQGSSGKVYPLPFTDRIAEQPTPRKWRAIWIENEFLRVLVLPEIGGRIHAIQDKTNGYDLIYRQEVIKPALVGLAGAWASGGIEFNWPQHHRPATFMPVDTQIEHSADGSATVWCGDHDPIARMKGMHGVRLRPDRACVELHVRAYNRTPLVQTFLWWANVATRVHEAYQSFFPPDVFYVADHARRSTSRYPLASGFYYGVNYGERARKGVPPSEVPRQFVPPHCRKDLEPRTSGVEPPGYAPNDLSFYANIPVPTSYMCMGSEEDYYLGNLLYDRRRHAEAIRLWERSARLDPTYSVVWRNLGIGYFNNRHSAGMARTVYDKAFRLNPADARLLFERDQLWKRLGEKPARRLREMEKRLDLVRQRDDLTIELCALYNQTGRHTDALALLSSRHFQPWEGGEGGPLGQWVRSLLALGRAALSSGRAARAREHFLAALTAPQNLGEAKHLLANQSDIHYWLGCACDALGDKNSARQHWLAAATFKGDFQEMSVRAFSAMTCYTAWAWERLGQSAKATKLFTDLLAYAQRLQETPAKIDYFATSLPTMLLFDDDLQFRQDTTAFFLQAQAHLGLKRHAKAKGVLAQVLKRDPNHALAADLLAELKEES